MTGIVKTGALATTVQIVSIGSQDPPMTITLTSTSGTRGIRLSDAGGIANSWYTPDLDSTTTASVSVSVGSPVTHVEFTGNIGDIYRVL